MLFIANVGRLLGISPCGCEPMLVACDCHADSCKCEVEIQVCRFEKTPGFIDVEWPREEVERADAEAEAFRIAHPAECEEMLTHHDALWKVDQKSYDLRMGELLRILDPDSYAERRHHSRSVSMLSWMPRTKAMRKRQRAGLSPFDAPEARDIDYKNGETLTHHRNGRGACHTGAIGEQATTLPRITIDPNDYESVRAARLEHARRP